MVKFFKKAFKPVGKISSHKSNSPIFHINSEYVEPLSTKRIKTLLDYANNQNMNKTDKMLYLKKYGIDMYKVEKYMVDVEVLNTCLYGSDNDSHASPFAAIKTGLVFVTFLIAVAFFKK